MSLVTGLLLIGVPLAFNALFFRLQQIFDYPTILRQSTAEILTRFARGGRALVLTWYGFAFSAVLFTPIPVLVHLAFGPAAPWYLTVATILGVIAGVLQFVGLMRWVFLVPVLAQRYLDPSAGPAAKEATAIVFEAFHRFVGVALGEHLGYLFTALWSLLLAIAIIETGAVWPILGWIGLLPAIGIALGTLEEAGFKFASAINAIAYVAWSLWLVALGVALLV